MASTVHEPTSRCSSRTCVYYPKIYGVPQNSTMSKYSKPSAEIYEMFFPGSCSQCSTLKISMDGLCPFCHHLRLQHSFYCLHAQESDPQPCLVLGRLALLQQRSGCTFCTFILRVVQNEAQTSQTIIDGSDFVMLSLHPFRSVSEMDFATSPDDFGDAYVEVWSGSQHKSIDSLMADETLFPPRKLYKPVLIRQREPQDEPNMMGEMVNWQRLRTWIKECTDEHIHDDPIPPPGENVLETILFIDVEKGCIVSTSSPCNYIALSYVWGDHTAGMAQTTKQSIDHLRKPGSLMGHRIPATIRDAMATCRLLGVSYLWVDRFCIVQDDERQKHEQIRSMGMIYSGALLTICAMAGDNADYGLPGVQARPRAQVRPRTFAFGVDVVPARPYDDSTWSSRGWTYQEKILSRRRLVFTDEEVFFECNQGASAEVSTPIEPPSRLASVGGYDTKVANYTNHVGAYSVRSLSYSSDVYNAFTGICGSIYPLEDLIHGLPTSAFDDALLWEPDDTSSTNDRWPRQILGKDLYVPSWSWASEFGHGAAYVEDFVALGSFAKWAFVEQQDRVRVIQSVDTPMGWGLSRSCYDPRLYLALAWREHVVESAPSFTICWDRPFEEIESRVIKGWQTYRHYWKEAHGNARIETHVQTKPVGRLLLRTSVATFRLTKARIMDNYGHWHMVYADGNFPCGWVTLLPIAVEKEMPEIVEPPRGVGRMFGRRRVQLVALSCTHFPRHYVNRLLEQHNKLLKLRLLESSPCQESSSDGMEREMADSSSSHAGYMTPETTYYDSTNSPLDPPPGIRVMMISWQGDVAYRVGLGVVLLRQWTKANPEFRTIVLE